MRNHKRLLLLLLPWALIATGSEPPQRYALVLTDPPLAAQILPLVAKRASLATPEAEVRRIKLLDMQGALKSVLAARKIAVTGSMQILQNAVFVSASPDRVAELQGLPGVAGLVPMATLHRQLNKALALANVTQAWSAVGGPTAAGAGMKIAVLDTGIDETHPGFKDPSLGTPAGYPKFGNADDATHATNKIIAVRSFVAQLALGDGSPESTRPDDLSARDRVGHGTAVAMIAAGVSHQSPVGNISGVAPKAWLGSYKIFGSPGVNDTTTADVVLQALEAAFNDGMDIAIVSAGSLSAMWSPSDQGAVCGTTAGVYCDVWAGAATLAAQGGMMIVAPAGNDGVSGPATINTPGDVASVLTVGATKNVRGLASTLRLSSGEQIPARLGDGPRIRVPLTSPVKTLTGVDSSELACLPLSAGSLAGAMVLVARGPLVNRGNCSYFAKVTNAAAAGAAAVLMFREPGDSQLFEPTGLVSTPIPAVLISADSASSLKAQIQAHPGLTATLDPSTQEIAGSQSETVAAFSSRGPNIGDSGIKPEVSAPGSAIYTAAQKYDPNGDLYSPDGYIGVDGTSFAAAFAAGAAALVKQAHPTYSAAQLKSALVNTASSGLLDSSGSLARIVAAGAGKLDVAASIASNLTVEPATAAFGIVSGSLPSRTLKIVNTGQSSLSLKFNVTATDSDSKASVSVSSVSATVSAGQSVQVIAALTGATPLAGSYEGFITISGGAVALRIPYLYIVGDGTPGTLAPLTRPFVTEMGTSVHVALRALDRSGSPVSATQVRFSPSTAVYAATRATDATGVAEAYLTTPNQSGDQSFGATLATGSPIEFDGRTRGRPDVAANGVVDGASFQRPAAFAPGSYISVFGSNLSEAAQVAGTPYLPVSLAGVSVSFDAPSTNVHAAGRIYFVSPQQISLQIPWELAGAGTALMKVTLSGSASRNVRAEDPLLGTYQTRMQTIPIGKFSPAFFEYTEPGTGTRVAAALDESNRVVGPANPVVAGHVVQFFLNGLGEVVAGTLPGSGEITPATLPLATTLATPTITIAGQPAVVQFSGLAPSNIGLYQVNAVVPTGVPAGLQSVVLSIGGTVSAPSNLWITGSK